MQYEALRSISSTPTKKEEKAAAARRMNICSISTPLKVELLSVE
jgi:hypothetical protein